MKFPQNDRTPLIRTDFVNDEAWRRVVDAASAASTDGFRAKLYVLDDRSFSNADPAALAEAANTSSDHVLLIIADSSTMNNAEMPLLCVDTIPPGGQFRVIPEHLWGVENNVSLANMDFSEFAAALDRDGVFRGFK
ncbi:DUF6924 domain-containing protein [Rhizobium herbae]|uniref:DUF6924 domain-containing protein n=1 Tax=Rhizobium herbae TaxID=508661 RepID=A0ABS4EPD6_9HYPH|nr:hypothetical protein [Rhizobium herbae]MBP1859812.1 hypothetical protein [Rhizobium herbae]